MQFYLPFIMSDFVNFIINLFRIWIEMANNNSYLIKYREELDYFNQNFSCDLDKCAPPPHTVCTDQWSCHSKFPKEKILI